MLTWLLTGVSSLRMAPSDFFRVSTMAKLQIRPPATLNNAYIRNAPPIPKCDSSDGKLRPTSKLRDLHTAERSNNLTHSATCRAQRAGRKDIMFPPSAKIFERDAQQAHQFNAVHTLATFALIWKPPTISDMITNGSGPAPQAKKPMKTNIAETDSRANCLPARHWAALAEEQNIAVALSTRGQSQGWLQS